MQGRTYSLFGPNDDTEVYYETIRKVAEHSLEIIPDHEILIVHLRKCSLNRRYFPGIPAGSRFHSLHEYLIHAFETELSMYTSAADVFSRTWRWSKLWDRRLRTTRFQHHLYMLEIELTNRMNRSAFFKRNKKIALLPYCLQDFDQGCSARFDGTDYQCAGCSGRCFVNAGRGILSGYGFRIYLWQSAKLETLGGPDSGILGIACIPELAWGLRKCASLNIPATGIPLNANRCKRWMDTFHENSYSLSALERMLKEGVNK